MGKKERESWGGKGKEGKEKEGKRLPINLMTGDESLH